MKNHGLLTLIIGVLFAAQLAAQNPARSGADYALFFVVQDFDHWQDFSSESISQVRQIETELKDNYGFRTEFVMNPTKQQVLDKLDAYAGRSFGSKDQLLVYFSMHGHYEEGRIGALIPKDGLLRDNAYQTWIPHPILEDLVSTIGCEHITLALDACYSGTFEGGRGKPQQPASMTSGDCASKAENALRYRSRLYVTSGGKERTPITSQFALKWIEALRMRNIDGVLSHGDLVGVLEDANPIPRYGNFKGHQTQGNFVFVHKYTCNTGQPGRLQSLQADSDAWQEAKTSNTLSAYRAYLARFPNGEFRPLAQQRIADMEAAQREASAWQQAKSTNTVQGYTDFINSYPNSAYKDIAIYNRSELEKTKGVTTPAIIKTTDLPNFVFVQGGTFQMGSDDGGSSEKPVHSVTLSDFYLARYELTVEEFSQFVSATNYKTDAEKGDGSYINNTSGSWEKKAGVNWRHDATGKTRPSSEYNHPAIHVSWNDAVAYCNWRSEQDGFQKVYSISGTNVTANWNANGYRLPTEAEWEFAARSRGKDYKFAWGNGNPKGNIADETAKKSFSGWTIWDGYSDGYTYTAPVNQFEQGDLGLFNMTGNVWEWCWDWYSSDYYGKSPSRDPRGPDSGSSRVLRGGSWSGIPAYLRCAFRLNLGPVFRYYDYGFRLARAAR